MARILCVWEMGLALGHLSNLKPFIDAALKAGHQVTLAAKELHNISAVLPDYPVAVFQAPYLHRPPRQPYKNLLSYSQLVLQRFENSAELSILYRAWDAIFTAVKPDLVIYDFAPSAMIASLNQPWEKWLVGSGFLVPRTDQSCLGIFPDVRNSPENNQQLRQADERLLAMINEVLHSHGRAPIDDVREIITGADRQLLLTLPELDHSGVRPGVEYLGVPAQLAGQKVPWPARGSCKVFAYLSGFPFLGRLLKKLSGPDFSVLVYSREIGDEVKARFPLIRFVDVPVDMGQVAEEADLVVNMGGHTTCAQSVLAGIPQLMIPLKQEQYYLARRVANLGGGLVLRKDDEELEAKVERMLTLARAGRLPVEKGRRELMSGQMLGQRLAELFSVSH